MDEKSPFMSILAPDQIALQLGSAAGIDGVLIITYNYLMDRSLVCEAVVVAKSSIDWYLVIERMCSERVAVLPTA